MPKTDYGTYALILHSTSNKSIQIGKLGPFTTKPGYYVYIGSAFGPGGIKARIKHHQSLATKPHWHIDYLRRTVELIEIWYNNATRKQEHAWANTLSKELLIPKSGFGSSDCQCKSHLFYSIHKPNIGILKNINKIQIYEQ